MTNTAKRVFLVEDDTAIADVYKIVLEKSQFEVDILSSGGDALKKIKEMGVAGAPLPDIFILDLILPDMNGMDVVAEVRANPATKSIPVFISSNQEEKDLPPMGDIKPDRFVVKANVTPTELVALIKQQLKII